MALTLLQIIQTAAAELGLTQPSAVVGISDIQIQQLLALVNRDGDNLRRTNDWTALQAEFNIAVSVPTATTGDVTNLSAVITNIPSTAGLSTAYAVSGSNIPQAARIASVDSATQVTMTMQATGTLAGAAIVFEKDTYTLPSDFDHYINQTWWDRTNRWALIGPDSPPLDEWHRSGIFTTGPRRHFRQIGPTSTSFRLWPPPATTDTPFQIVFEYISKNWVVNAAGTTYQSSFQADTDMPLLDDQALVLGCKWRMWQIKGFDYGPLLGEYNDYCDQLRARDGGARTLSIVPRETSILISPANTPDGNWPGPTGPNMS